MKTDWFVNPSKLFVKYELLLHTEVDVFMCLPLFSNPFVLIVKLVLMSLLYMWVIHIYMYHYYHLYGVYSNRVLNFSLVIVHHFFHVFFLSFPCQPIQDLPEYFCSMTIYTWPTTRKLCFQHYRMVWKHWLLEKFVTGGDNVKQKFSVLTCQIKLQGKSW